MIKFKTSFSLVPQHVDKITDGATKEETIKNILSWMHNESGIKPPSECSQELKTLLNYDSDKESYPSYVKRKRTATTILNSKCFTGCTDYTILFVALARAKGIPATVTETIREKWVAKMVWNNKFNNDVEGHFFSEVYLSDLDKWVVVDPASNELTGRDDNGYYPYTIMGESGEPEVKRYMLLERGIDYHDYDIKTIDDLKDTVKKRYYIEDSQP